MSNQGSLDIQRRRPFDGDAFGDHGAYERLDGQAKFAVDPDAAPPGVVDLKRAPRNAEGLVELQRTFLLSAFKCRTNGRLFFDYKAGNMRAIQFFNDALSNDPCLGACWERTTLCVAATLSRIALGKATSGAMANDDGIAGRGQ